VTTTSVNWSELAVADETVCAAALPHQPTMTADALMHKTWIFMTPPSVADALSWRVRGYLH
jgi:hypothetical protein